MSCHSSPSLDTARTQSPARRPARSATLGRDRRPEHRLRLLDADPGLHRVERDREQQVGQRTGGDDRRALPERLAVEGKVPLVGRDRTLALVEHAHVAAERQGADHELGAVGPRLAPPQHPAEADREAQHLDAAGDRHPVVAVLVDDDQHPQREQEGEDGRDRRHAVIYSRSCSGTGPRAAAPRHRERAATRANRPRPPAGSRPPSSGVDLVNPVEADGSGKKRRHRLLVGGIEHRARARRAAQRVVGQAERRIEARDRPLRR